MSSKKALSIANAVFQHLDDRGLEIYGDHKAVVVHRRLHRSLYEALKGERIDVRIAHENAPGASDRRIIHDLQALIRECDVAHNVQHVVLMTSDTDFCDVLEEVRLFGYTTWVFTRRGFCSHCPEQRDWFHRIADHVIDIGDILPVSAS